MRYQEIDGTYVAVDKITHVAVSGTTSETIEVRLGDLTVASLGPYPAGDARVQERLDAIVRGDSPVSA